MRIFAALMIAATAFAQTAIFPGGVVTDNQLGIAGNVTRAQLANSITAAATTISVANSSCVKAGYSVACTAAFVPNMMLVLDNEAVQICSVTAAALTTALQVGHSSCPNIDGRGFDGTTAAAHNAAIISSIAIAWNHNATNKEVEAVEGALSGIFPIKSYGAKCDGTTDDTAAILAAVSAATLANGNVILSPGTCPFSSEIAVSKRLSIIGCGAGDTGTTSQACSILKKTANVIGIHVKSGANYTVLKGFRLTSTASTGSADGIDIGDIDSTNGAGEVRIEDVIVDSQKGNGINVRNGNSQVIDHVATSANGIHGILIDSQNTMTDNTNASRIYSASGFSNVADGLHLGKASATNGLGLDFEGNGGIGVYANRSYIYLVGHSENNTGLDLVTGSACFGCVMFISTLQTPTQGSPSSYFYDMKNALGPTASPNGRFGTLAGFSTPLVVPTYGTTITINPDLGNTFEIDVANATGFTISAPSGSTSPSMRITITVKNVSGGAMGAISWNFQYLMSAWTNPANAFSRSIDFEFDTSAFRWREVSRTSSDIPN